MATRREFLDETKVEGLSYLDGFRFGLGFFIAWTLGLAVVCAVVTLALMLVRR